MPGVSRVGTDMAGGVIGGPGAGTVRINGSACSLLGDSVTPHGVAPHAGASMAAASSTVFAEGGRVVRSGDLASCGHAATGSSNVFAN